MQNVKRSKRGFYAVLLVGERTGAGKYGGTVGCHSTENIIDVDDLPPVMKNPMNPKKYCASGDTALKQVLEEAERQLLMKARSVYNSTYKMAQALGVNQSTVVRKPENISD